MLGLHRYTASRYALSLHISIFFPTFHMITKCVFRYVILTDICSLVNLSLWRQHVYLFPIRSVARWPTAMAADRWCFPWTSRRYSGCSSRARRCPRRTRCLGSNGRWTFCNRSDSPVDRAAFNGGQKGEESHGKCYSV